jgi:Na+-driven multidrug efflux pump
MAFTVVCNAAIGVLVALFAPYIPRLYNTEPEVRDLSQRMLQIEGAYLPSTPSSTPRISPSAPAAGPL